MRSTICKEFYNVMVSVRWSFEEIFKERGDRYNYLLLVLTRGTVGVKH